jgi:lysophospholipase L1-like esterase
MAAPALGIAAKAAARAAGAQVVDRVRPRLDPPPPPPKGGGSAAKAIAAIAVLIVLLPALIVAVLFGGAQQSSDCAPADALPGTWTGPGSLGGVAGTGVTPTELTAARRIGGTQITAGVYSPTAYFPNPNAPSTNCAATCISTASGIRVNNATRRAYLIASSQRLNQYGALAYIWPNPYGWTGPFVVADTGDDFHGAGRLDFYIFMNTGESWQSALGRAYQWGPANKVKLSAAPIRPGGPTIATSPLGPGPGDLAPGGTPPPLAIPATPVQGTGPVLNLGDSLAVGSGPPLEAKLTGRTVTTVAAKNRTSSQGLAALRGVAAVPTTIVVQLGTNDTHVARFRRNVRSILAIARRAAARVLWVNIARPPLDGATDAELNDVLLAEQARHDNLDLVDWNAAVSSGRVELGDGVHPTGAGYATRAQLITEALLAAGPAIAGACGAPTAPGSLGELSGAPEQIVNRVVEYAHNNGFPTITPESVRAANAVHGRTVDGNTSDHEGPPDLAWAADISDTWSNPDRAMDTLARTLATAFDITWPGAGLATGGNGEYRIQLIYRTCGGGDHFTHVHFGVKRVGWIGPDIVQPAYGPSPCHART